MNTVGYRLVLIAGLMLGGIDVLAQVSEDVGNTVLKQAVRQLLVEDAQSPEPALLQSPHEYLQRTGLRLLVLPLENDPELELTDEILVTLANAARFQVASRADMNKVVDEFRWNYDNEDLIDPATLVEMGRFLGVQGILFGRVKELDLSEQAGTVHVVLKLVDVETNRLVWGKSLKLTQRAPAPPPVPPDYRRPIIIALLGIAALALIAYLRSLRPQSLRESTRQDGASRAGASVEFGRAVASLRSAQKHAFDSGQTATVERIKLVQDAIDNLRRDVDNAVVISRRQKPGIAEDVAQLGNAFREAVSELSSIAHRVFLSCQGQRFDQAREQLDELEVQSRRLRDMFQSRREAMKS